MFKENIRQLRKAKKLNQDELAKIVNVSSDTIRRYESGEREPRITELQALAAALGTSVSALMGEETPHVTDKHAVAEARSASDAELKGETPPELRSNGRLIPQDWLMWIPVISPEIKVCAGNGNDYSDSDLDWTVIEHVPIADGELSALYSAENLLGMYVEGDSMEPQIHDGDLVIFNHDTAWVSGNIMVVCLDGRLMVKGVISKKGEIVLRSSNRDYEDIQVDEGSFFIVYGRVLRIARISRPKPII